MTMQVNANSYSLGTVTQLLPEEATLAKLQQQKFQLDRERDIARRKEEALRRADDLRKQIEALGATPCA